MNLLIFIYSLSSGGAERVTINLANHWADKGWKITIVTLAPKTLDLYALHPAVKRIALDIAKESPNPLAAIANNLHRILALRRVLKEVKPDLALAMMSSANVLIALSAIGLKSITTIGAERIHPPQFPLGKIWEALRRQLYGHLTAVVALTQESATWLRQHTQAKNIVVIPNAAVWPLPEIHPHLEPLAMLKKRKLLLAAGRLIERKGFGLLIGTFQRLAKDIPDWILVILGEGTGREILEDQIQSASLADRVFLPGRAGNMSQWYEIADLYVMPSRFEGFPNTLIEAMAHGCSAVSFDCDTGPRDIIRHEIDGLLVPAGDSNALEKTLRKMMSNQALREQYAEKALEVRERFSMQRVTGMWEQLFEEVKQ